MSIVISSKKERKSSSNFYIDDASLNTTKKNPYGNTDSRILLPKVRRPHASNSFRSTGSSVVDRLQELNGVFHPLLHSASISCSTTITFKAEEYTPIKIIEKLIQNQSNEENILELLTILSANERKLKDRCYLQDNEIIDLKFSHDKKNRELHTSLYKSEESREYINEIKQQNNALKESLREKDLIITKLENSNLTLLTQVHNTNKKSDPPGRPRATSPSKKNNGDNTSKAIDPSMKDEKLRNSLLTITREKYRMTKKVEVLGAEVEILKSKSEILELRCRHLQIDLAEYRGTDDATSFTLNLTTGQPS